MTDQEIIKIDAADLPPEELPAPALPPIEPQPDQAGEDSPGTDAPGTGTADVEEPSPGTILPADLETIVIEAGDLVEPEHIVIQPADLAPDTPSPVNPGAEIVEVEVPEIVCAYCLNPIHTGEEAGICQRCATPYHAECFQQKGGCSILDCPGAHDRQSFQAQIV